LKRIAGHFCTPTSSPLNWSTRMRFPIILAVAAFALAGCNANQAVNPSSQNASQVWAGHDVETNPYDPTSYAQNQTGRGGGR
jgi:outer membrane biogenesis lipoprotein LolB